MTVKLQNIIEAALMVAGQPLNVAALQGLFAEEDKPTAADIKLAISSIKERYDNSGIELCEVATGYRLQTRAELSPWLAKLWEERAPRYSRAFLETLAIIAYKQPVTRAEIEEIRGVSVSSHIIKTLQEREWIRIIGYREVPGRPAIYGTTKDFLDYFNLKSLTELPTLAEFKNLEAQELQVQLAMEEAAESKDESNDDNPSNIIALNQNASHPETIEDEDEEDAESIHDQSNAVEQTSS